MSVFNVTATLLVILILFLNFCNFLNYDFFQNNKRHAFPKLFCSRLFLVDELNVLLKSEFSYDRFELAVVYNCKFKANFILRTSAEVSWSSASPRQILLFSETKRRKPQRCTSERHLKDERKTNITSNLNLAVLHDSSLSLSAAHFFITILYKWKKKITFLEQWNWMVDCPVDSKKLQKYF